MATGERRHPDEAALLKFVGRQDQTAAYVMKTADWIKAEYPASAASMLPKLRQIYREKSTKGYQAATS